MLCPIETWTRQKKPVGETPAVWTCSFFLLLYWFLCRTHMVCQPSRTECTVICPPPPHPPPVFCCPKTFLQPLIFLFTISIGERWKGLRMHVRFCHKQGVQAPLRLCWSTVEGRLKCYKSVVLVLLQSQWWQVGRTNETGLVFNKPCSLKHDTSGAPLWKFLVPLGTIHCTYSQDY